jgi:hypothetical protein
MQSEHMIVAQSPWELVPHRLANGLGVTLRLSECRRSPCKSTMRPLHPRLRQGRQEALLRWLLHPQQNRAPCRRRRRRCSSSSSR